MTCSARVKAKLSAGIISPGYALCASIYALSKALIFV
ncbi:MAG: hypothetical protein QOC96_3681 [Acidobacteriota bacterium]|jgi:hypothetical protein|nr:hypothetical protein [Acidobacteriota bacterium]